MCRWSSPVPVRFRRKAHARTVPSPGRRSGTRSCPCRALPVTGFGGERSAAGGRQVERFTQGHESHVVPGACSPRPTATAPSDPVAYQDEIDLPPSGRLDASPVAGVSWPQTPRPEPRRKRPNSSSLHSPASQRAAWAVSSGRGLRLKRRARREALFPPVQKPPCDRGSKHAVFSGVWAYACNVTNGKATPIRHRSPASHNWTEPI